jgi:hypothetical protein
MALHLKTLILLLFLIGHTSCSKRESLPFTAWMPRAQFVEFLKEKETKDKDGKNFWLIR